MEATIESTSPGAGSMLVKVVPSPGLRPQEHVGRKKITVATKVPRQSVAQANSTAHGWRRTCWVLVAVLHGLSASYHGLMAVVYGYGSSVLALFGPRRYVERVMIDKKHFQFISGVAALLCLIHVAMLARMVMASLVTRRLAFQRISNPKDVHAAASFSSATCRLEDSASRSCCVIRSVRVSKGGRAVLRWLRTLGKCLYFCFVDRQGLMGIDGPHFERIFLAREVFQVGFQSWQAWRMSERVAIAWLNRFNVVLVCLNCWSVPTLECWIERRRAQESTRSGTHQGVRVRYRLPVVLIDCCLDSLAVSLMSLVILVPYLRVFDTSMRMFPPWLWRDDQWLARVMNEFQLVFVVNWADAVSRVMFALLTVLSLNAVHELCHDHFDEAPTETKPVVRSLKRVPSGLVDTKSAHSRLHRCIRGALMSWGVFIAVLHILASWRHPVSHCVMALGPWGESKLACAAVVYNCYRAGSNGSRLAIEPVFQAISSQYVSLIVFQHCPALEMPRTLQTHSRLVSLTIHNSTIIDWPTDTAFTSTAHPLLQALQLCRVTWSDGGELPKGLVDPRFPQTLTQVYILQSNLRTLPANLHEIWPQRMSFTCDACKLCSFPTALTKLNLAFLSLANNELSNLPLPDLVGTTHTAMIIGASYNPIVELRSEIGSPTPVLSTSLRWLVLYRTNLTTLPSWLLTMEAPLLLIRAGGTPFCESIDQSEMDPIVRERVNCEPPPPWDGVANDVAAQDRLHPL